MNDKIKDIISAARVERPTRKTAKNGIDNSPKMSQEEREFVTYAYAAGLRLMVIKTQLEQRYGTKITPSSLYDFRKAHQEEIDELRAQCREEIITARVPFTEKLQRIANYAAFADHAITRRNHPDAAKYLRLIAEEMGDLRQKHEIGGPNGGPIEYADASRDEIVNGIEATLNKLISRAESYGVVDAGKPAQKTRKENG